jgi:hypothetical protein
MGLFIIGFLVFCAIQYAFRFFTSPPGLILIAIGFVYSVLVFPLFTHLIHYPEAITVLAAEVESPSSHNPDVFDGVGIPSVTLTIKSTFERPYDASSAICGLRGPLYFATANGTWSGFIDEQTALRDVNGRLPGDQKYQGVPSASVRHGDLVSLGERRILVTLFAVNRTRLGRGDELPVTIHAAERTLGFDKPDPITKSITYLLTTPRDALSRSDKMEWCKVGASLRQLAAESHVSLDARGVITGDRIQWIREGQHVPLAELVQSNVRREAEDVIPLLQ